MRSKRMRSAISFPGLRYEQPSPQVSVWRLLTMQLDIETSRGEVVDLRLGELDRSGNRAAGVLCRRQIADRRAAHAGLRAAMQADDGPGRLQAAERAVDGQRGAL